MKNILLLGAGRSSSTLIQYLNEHAPTENWHLRVGDADVKGAQSRFPGMPHVSWFLLDANDLNLCSAEISGSDLVISMLPAFMHPTIAGLCLELGKHLITPSYVSPEMEAMHTAAVDKGIIFLNEMGLDPGIDHMSAMAILDEIREKGGEMLSFESFTGGLVAPESDNNPWHYKISWNPRNIVMAGAGGSAKYLQNGNYNYTPYHQLFARTTVIDLGEDGVFEGYANRDSLKYRSVYGLDSIPSLIRGTLRKSPFCKGWNVIVNLGLTDESFEIEKPEELSWCDLLCAFTGQSDVASLKKYITTNYHIDQTVLDMLEWLGLFSDRKVAGKACTPALALQWLLEEKWKLGADDKDMVVMYHRFVYRLADAKFEQIATLVDLGVDSVQTSMARTVGLPVAIAAKMILNGKIAARGVLMPTQKEIYQPVLEELSALGIRFTESLRTIQE
jgi:saccharopine dehydrogenase-like NADP-dependent oxidoreductase